MTPRQNFTCETRNATYETRLILVNEVQNVLIEQIRYEDRVVSSTPGSYPYLDGSVLPGYAAWYMALTRLLQGYVLQTDKIVNSQNVTTKILELSLAGCPELSAIGVVRGCGRQCPARNLLRAIEDLSPNATLSLLAGDMRVSYTPARVNVSAAQLSYRYSAVALHLIPLLWLLHY